MSINVKLLKQIRDTFSDSKSRSQCNSNLKWCKFERGAIMDNTVQLRKWKWSAHIVFILLSLSLCSPLFVCIFSDRNIFIWMRWKATKWFTTQHTLVAIHFFFSQIKECWKRWKFLKQLKVDQQKPHTRLQCRGFFVCLFVCKRCESGLKF